MNKCSVCKTLKGIEEFSKDRSRKNGLDHTCKSCRKDMLVMRRGEAPNKLVLVTGENLFDIPERLKKKLSSLEKYSCRCWLAWEGIVYRWDALDKGPVMSLEKFMDTHRWEELR